MQHRLQSLKERALNCLRSQQLVQAKALLKELCEADQRDIEAWNMLAAVNAQLGALDEVAACCRQIVVLKPDDYTGHFNLGVAYQTLGLNDKAEKCYRQVLRIQPGNTAALTNLGFVLLTLEKVQEAIGCFNQALGIDSSIAHANNGLGLAFKKQGNLQAACANFIQACRLNPDLAEAHYNLGLTFALQDDRTKAAESYAMAIRCKPDYVEACFELGNTLIADGRYAEAETNYLHAIRLRPGFAAAHFQLGHTYYLQDKNTEALRSYRQVLAIEPANSSALNNCGRIYERTGAFEEAIRHFRLALAGKSDSLIICNIGHVYMAQGDWSSAAKQYRDAVMLAPDAFEAHMGLGQACCELGLTDEAKQCFRKVIELKPDLRIAKYFLANLESKALTDTDVSDYVAGLFDDYAPKFDTDLVDKLQYHIPELLHERIKNILGDSAEKLNVLDLGCGTGLCGPLFRTMALRLDGVDLSSRMIDKARERAVYDGLQVGDITTIMLACDRHYDLIIAADVFVYIGDLAPVFEASASLLPSGGLFTFSIELLQGKGFHLQNSGRQAHSSQYIEDLLSPNGLEQVDRKECMVRLEKGKPVSGMIYILRKI